MLDANDAITGDLLTINVVKSSSLINTQNPIHSSVSCISSNVSLKNEMVKNEEESLLQQVPNYDNHSVHNDSAIIKAIRLPSSNNYC